MKLLKRFRKSLEPRSRPFTGAWIETVDLLMAESAGRVAPSRGRGLKQLSSVRVFDVRRRRPFTGAWIETGWDATSSGGSIVAPSRGRGLKPAMPSFRTRADGVAPSRGRGLKHGKTCHVWESVCRPFTGAWIETRSLTQLIYAQLGRPFTGAWIETTPGYVGDTGSAKSPLHGGVD